MRRSKGKHVYKSVEEFQKHFFPKSFEQKKAEELDEPQAIGISLAKESLAKIRGN